MGRLLRVGSGRERGADAVARRDGVPALGDDPGEAGDAPRLERHLVSGAFVLALFGTFLTRSGVVSSIHSFTQSSIGPILLGFVGAAALLSAVVIVLRLPLLRTRTRLESPISREATFLYNNLLLVALALTILWGVIYPIVSEAVRGERATVGPPYYNFFLQTFGLPLLLLMGIGPLIAWRRASLRSLGRTFIWPCAVALAAGAVLLALGAGSSIPGLLAYTFSAFALTSIALELVRGTRARHALGAGGWFASLTSLIALNRRRYGGYIVHAAIVLLAIGIAGSSAYETRGEGRLAVGQTLAVGDYTLALRDVETRRGPNAIEARAVIDVTRDGRSLGTLRAGKNAYPVEDQVSNEVAVRSDRLTAEDLFVIADELRPAAGSVYLKVFVKPLMNLVWLAGLFFVAGALVAMWPDAREARRLEARYAGARAARA